MIRSGRWSRVRAAFQIIAWLFFVALVIALRDPVEREALFGIVPLLSAHLGLATSLAARQLLSAFWPALVVLALTLAFGRFFCGWICPMGATIDATDHAVRPDKINEWRRNGRMLWIKPVKYAVLAVSLILAIAGANAAGIIDPLSLAFRSYSTVLFAYADRLAKLVFEALAAVPALSAVAEPIYGLLRERALDPNPVVFHGHLAVLAVFVGVLAVSRLARRFWCQALCPFGAVIALTARIGLLRRVVDTEACTTCRRCERSCRMNAITDSGRGTREEECVKCFECLDACRDGAISFRFSRPFGKAARPAPAAGGVRTRRQLLAGLASSALLVPLVKHNAEARKDFSAVIRPPGALPEREFLSQCLRCGACMKACPTNALHPAVMETGLEGLFTPRLIPRIGYCEYSCVLCTRICPTDALRPLAEADKEREVIGTAVIDRNLCIPWAEARECLVCEEMCPVADKAIKLRRTRMRRNDGKAVSVSLPFVVEDRCIGCGACENKCPVSGSSAITVRVPKKAPASRESSD